MRQRPLGAEVSLDRAPTGSSLQAPQPSTALVIIIHSFTLPKPVKHSELPFQPVSFGSTARLSPLSLAVNTAISAFLLHPGTRNFNPHFSANLLRSLLHAEPPSSKWFS